MKIDSKRIFKIWDFCSRLPFGTTLFSRALGFLVPYTGSVKPRVVELRPGFAEAELYDRRAIRNHLGSVHAVALMNVGELVTGLACLTSLPPGGRTILKSLKIDYHKKARGKLVARAETPLNSEVKKIDVVVTGRVYNSSGDLVSTVEAVWNVDLFK